MNTIYLHGHLAEVGKEFKLNVKTPAQAIHLLAVQLKEFTHKLRKGNYHVRLGNTNLDKTTLHANLGKHDLHIIPEISGANGGTVMLIAGIAILAIASGGALLAPGATLLETGIGWGTLGLMGAGMVAGGVSQMLMKPPKTAVPRVTPEDNASQLFSGLANTATQGVPVPVVYGRMLVGSVIVSTGLTNEA